jgi:hypothetical protein
MVPTVRVEQLDEPVQLTYRLEEDAGGESGFALRNAGPVTYLGVSAVPPPRELSPHLPIPEDTGLVVEFLAKDSPAEKAGLQQRDVLAKLDDQILIHPRQLAVLVAGHKEGDSVKIVFVRKGQVQEATAVLGKQDAAANAANPSLPGADVVFRGRPLQTFVRRLSTTTPDGPHLEMFQNAQKAFQYAAAAGADQQAQASAAAGAVGAEQAELEQIRRMLEDLSKRLEEKK